MKLREHLITSMQNDLIQDIILKFSKFNDKDWIFKTEKKKKKNDNLQKNAHKLLTETLKDMMECNDIFKILID